jgi:hypothetical protein
MTADYRCGFRGCTDSLGHDDPSHEAYDPEHSFERETRLAHSNVPVTAAPLTLGEFLSARLDEEEREALTIAQVAHDRLEWIRGWDGDRVSYVLATVAAHRAILAVHEPEWEAGGRYQCEVCSDLCPCRTLRLLAQPYRFHPDWKPEWHVPEYATGEWELEQFRQPHGRWRMAGRPVRPSRTYRAPRN